MHIRVEGDTSSIDTLQTRTYYTHIGVDQISGSSFIERVGFVDSLSRYFFPNYCDSTTLIYLLVRDYAVVI